MSEDILLNNQAIKTAEDIDFSAVEKTDRVALRAIILRILTFHSVMPKLTTNIYSAPDHYNITIYGWNQYISLKQLYKVFLDPRAKKESSVLDYVTDIEIIPTDDDGKAKLLFKVAKKDGIRIDKKFI
jgi:hypothetical protein